MNDIHPRKRKMQRQAATRQQGQPTKTFPIKGMHCASCELLITEELEAVPGIERATVSLKTKSATILTNGEVPNSAIHAAIQAAGYEVGLEDDHKPLFTRNRGVWQDITIGIALVIWLTLMFKLFSLDKVFGSATSSNGTGVMALLVGLTAGFSTCMALIGGLVLSVAAKYAENHPAETSLQKFRPHLFFNSGRIVSFIVLGALIGAVGSALSLKGSLLGLLTIIVGLVMLILGLQLTEVSPRIAKGFTLPSGLAKRLGIKKGTEKEYSHTHAFLLGAATFFLPCGFTQAMQLLAISTGNPLQAATIMGAFALGTAPGLLSLGGLTSLVKGLFAKRFFRVVGVLVVAMAFINFSSGYTLMGLNNFVDQLTSTIGNSFQKTQETTTTSTGDAAILDTTYYAHTDISPRNFMAHVGQKTTLRVDVKDEGQGCMGTIMIIGLDETPQLLRKGKRLELTFTATQVGKYTIACAMGIPRGTITVIN